MRRFSQKVRDQRLAAREALARSGDLAFKPVSSAKWTNISISPRGAMRVQIEHDDIAGATPQMMRWWFENMAGTTTWNGVDFTGPEITCGTIATTLRSRLSHRHRAAPRTRASRWER